VESMIEWHRLRHRRVLTGCIRCPHPRHEPQRHSRAHHRASDECSPRGGIGPRRKERGHDEYTLITTSADSGDRHPGGGRAREL
jgi:hypothetical protein